MHVPRTTSRPRVSAGARAFQDPAEELVFVIGDTELGLVLIARSMVGVCSILMGSNEDELCEDLGRRFPKHKLVRDDAKLAEDVRKVQQYMATPAVGLDFALDVRGTRWQRRVWTALLAVPAGALVTYSALANRLGEPDSARAVARACAENAIALAIPCHRVIRKDGTLSGYRWSVERKRALLAKEAA